MDRFAGRGTTPAYRGSARSVIGTPHFLMVPYMANSLRQAGIKRTADLYIATLADPELARVLISKMPTSADSGTLHSFSRLLKRGLILGPMALQQGQK